MPKCANCGNEFHDGPCHKCGKDSASSLRATNKQLQRYSYLLIGGLAGTLVATRFYPPLDIGRLLIFAIGIFFLPVLAHVILSIKKRLTSNADRMRSAYKYCGALSVLLAGVLFLNGALDHSPVNPTRTSILRKTLSRGRSTSRYLIVASWRPDRFEEKLQVNRDTYQRFRTGAPVVIEIHRGLFGIPWYGQISPAPAE
jgi:hypothetical protein